VVAKLRESRRPCWLLLLLLLLLLTGRTGLLLKLLFVCDP
jgi:hypothetical protein